jgi:tetratricopeptide (TPR) repeat protein
VTFILFLALTISIRPTLEGDAAGPLAAADLALSRIDYVSATESLEQAQEIAPADPAVHWKFARVHVLIAEVLTGEEQSRHLRAAERQAHEAIALDSLCAPGYTWLAASLGYRALQAGSAEQVTLSSEILWATEMAIRLDPTDDIAYSIRGSTFRALGNVGWLQRSIASLFFGEVPEGGFAEAEEALRMAVRLAPEIMRHRYELAILLLDMDREQEGRQMLKSASELPVKTASDVPRLETIRVLLAMEHPVSPKLTPEGGAE